MSRDTPFLSGSDLRSGVTILEAAASLAGESWSEGQAEGPPVCVHPVLAEMAMYVGGFLDDADRQALLPEVPRLAVTSGGSDDLVLNVRLATWCAREALRHSDYPSESTAAIDAAQAWADCPCEAHGETAGMAASALRRESQEAAALAAYAANYAATPNTAAGAFGVGVPDTPAAALEAAVDAASSAAWAVYYGGTAGPGPGQKRVNVKAGPVAAVDLLALLFGLLDEYDRLTGRTEIPTLTESDLDRLRDLSSKTRPTHPSTGAIS